MPNETPKMGPGVVLRSQAGGVFYMDEDWELYDSEGYACGSVAGGEPLAVVGNIGDLVAEVERLRQDRKDAAGELMVELPEPRTDAAKMLAANRLLRAERERLREALELLADGRNWREDCGMTVWAGEEGETCIVSEHPRQIAKAALSDAQPGGEGE